MVRARLTVALAAMVFFLTYPQGSMAQQRSMDQVMEIVAQSPVGNIVGSAKSKMFAGTQAQAAVGNEPYYIFSSGMGKGFVGVQQAK